MKEKITHGSLFSGIGGFDLAAEWMGWNNVFHCEWNDFGQKVLNYYWPNAESYEDITKTDFRKFRGHIDVLTGGFPCQPFSVSGKRNGANDDRYLWPEMLRAIKEIQPSWVVGENVTGIVTMVQPGEIIKVESQASLFEEEYSMLEYEQNFVIETICSDLQNIGYSVQPIVIPACAVGAPHRRDRVWFIAYADICSERSSRKSHKAKINRSKNNDESKGGRRKTKQHTGSHDVLRLAPYAANSRIKSLRRERKNSVYELRIATNPNSLRGWNENDGERQRTEECSSDSKTDSWQNFPTQSPVCNGNDGISSRLDGITFSKWRQESIKAGGNAIVPQVVYEIFKTLF